MKNKVIFLFLALVIPWGGFSEFSAIAQNSSAKPPPKIVKEEGKPILIEFPDGRKAGLYYRDISRVLESELNLAENTCTSTAKAFCKIKLPYTGRSYVAIWLSHPEAQKIGNYIRRPDYDDKTKLNIETTQWTKFPIISGWTPEDLRKQKMSPGELQCTSTDWVPWDNNEMNVIYWDEDFETSNDELVFTGNSGAPSVNAFAARFEGLKLQRKNSHDKKILLSQFTAYKSAYKSFLEFVLIAYKLQWVFAKPSLENSYDSSCQVKLDNNFGKVFTEFTRNLQVTDAVPSSEFSPLIAGSAKTTGLQTYWLTEGQWNSSDFQ